jgi:hypothetical protein
MGVAVGAGVLGPEASSWFTDSEFTPRPTSASFAELHDESSGSFSNQHGQQPLHIEILDAKR